MRRENNTFIKFDVVHSMVGGAMSGEPNGHFTFHDGQTPPTEEEIDAEIISLQSEYDAQAYSRSREAEYPTIQECVHAILDDTLDALQAKRASVKLKYPKGE